MIRLSIYVCAFVAVSAVGYAAYMIALAPPPHGGCSMGICF
ncbi:hypothetical protein [Acetobacter indonesiensis]